MSKVAFPYHSHPLLERAVYIYYAKDAVTCPWEVWEKLPDGRKQLVAALQTSAEAVSFANDLTPVKS